MSDASNHRVLVFDGIPATSFDAADRVLGQLAPNLDQPNPGGVSAATLMRPAGVFSDGQRLYVCDSQNHRVLVWDAPPTANGTPADHVLGQADFTSNAPDRGAPAPAADTFFGPTNVHSDGQRLYVSDTDNNRLLIWDLPLDFTTEGPAADAVLGQMDFVSGDVNGGGSAAANTLRGPRGLFTDGATLAVADTFNYRALLWTIPPTWTNGEPATNVLGQPDFTSASANQDDGSPTLCPPEAASSGRTRRTLNQPTDVFAAAGRTIVADRNNNRILIWNSWPPPAYACAETVLGQPGGTTGTANSGGLSATSLRRPQAVFADATTLLIYDETNSRVKIHQSLPVADDAPADLVIGQPDFASGLSNHRVIDAASMNFPSGLAASDARVAVADAGNNRVLIWDPAPTGNGQPADVVLGQPDFSTVLPSPTATGLTQPTGVCLAMADSVLFVADRGANRVLVYDAPFSTQMAARAAIGQPDLTSNLAALGTNRFFRPSSIHWDGTFLWVADEENHRILRFSSPFVTDMSADIVLGQPGFGTGGLDGGGSGSRNLHNPVDVFSTGSALLVADRENHRVLVWDSLPSATNEPATAVLGQPDFTTPGAPLGGRAGLTTPVGVHVDAGRVLVHDGGNHRILEWSTLPLAGSSGLPADDVFGQADFDGATPNAGGVSDSSLNIGSAFPGGAERTAGGLFLADPQNFRVLRF